MPNWKYHQHQKHDHRFVQFFDFDVCLLCGWQTRLEKVNA